MRTKEKKIYFLIIIMFIYEVLMLALYKNEFIINNMNYINISFWLFIAIMIYFIEKGVYHRNIYNTSIFKITLISILFYFIIYYFLGFVFGFMKSPLSFSLKSIISNLVMIGLLRLIQEYIRYSSIKANNGKLTSILIYIIMVLAFVNTNTLISNFGNGISLFKYISSSIIPIMAFGLIENYISKIGDFKALLSIALPITIAPLVISIAPNLNWFIYSVYNITYCLLLYLIINYYLYYHTTDNNMIIKKKQSPLYLIPFMFVFTIMILFVLGIFNYVPIAVLSNSMYPYFKRGDILVYKKISNLENLKSGDVICYVNSDKIIIMHRIVSVTEEKHELYFTTKGDNNNTNDVLKVSENKVVGIMKVVIPKAGYPTVWLYEILKD